MDVKCRIEGNTMYLSLCGELDEYSAKYGIPKERFIVSSDAHYLGDMADAENFFEIDDEPYSSSLVRKKIFERLTQGI